jgi:hypothetical protein
MLIADQYFTDRQIDTAIAWHDGGRSPLYLLAATGVVHGLEHRAGLLSELDQCLRELDERWPEGFERDVEERYLKSLREAVSLIQLD